MKTLKSFLLYAGLKKKDFDELAPNAMRANLKSLKTYSLLAVIVFSGLFLITVLTTSIADNNRILYGIMALFNGLIFVCVWFFLHDYHGVILPAEYLFMAGLYAFSLAVTALHADLPAVTPVVLLFAVPFILYDRPVRMIAMTVLVTVSVCIVSGHFKTDDVARMDVWNAISFGAVAIVVETLQQRNKYRMLYQEREVSYLSQTDVLTGAKNRNHYEQRILQYPAECRSLLTCIYVDVNGLHETNNKQGHAAGDQLLIASAHALIDAFGKENTYRVGGDEFVCFGLDIPENEMREHMTKIQKELEESHYFISWGAASAVRDKIDMHQITGDAEAEMSAAKSIYYLRNGYDRRRGAR